MKLKSEKIEANGPTIVDSSQCGPTISPGLGLSPVPASQIIKDQEAIIEELLKENSQLNEPVDEQILGETMYILVFVSLFTLFGCLLVCCFSK